MTSGIVNRLFLLLAASLRQVWNNIPQVSLEIPVVPRSTILVRSSSMPHLEIDSMSIIVGQIHGNLNHMCCNLRLCFIYFLTFYATFCSYRMTQGGLRQLSFCFCCSPTNIVSLLIVTLSCCLAQIPEPGVPRPPVPNEVQALSSFFGVGSVVIGNVDMII